MLGLNLEDFKNRKNNRSYFRILIYQVQFYIFNRFLTLNQLNYFFIIKLTIKSLSVSHPIVSIFYHFSGS